MNIPIQKLTYYFTSSIRRQLMMGIILVHAILMSIFVFDLVSKQHSFLHDQSIKQAYSLSQTLAANSTSWILTNDVIGLEEIITSQNSYPDLKYAMVLGVDGRVLGHTDVDNVGLFISDSTSQAILTADNKPLTLVNSKELIDVASPIFSNNHLIGWARVSLSQDKINSGLSLITRNGMAYTTLAIAIGALFAFFMAKGITSSLSHIIRITEGIKKGDLNLRSTLNRQDELGRLSNYFNMMLDGLDRAKNEINQTHKELIEKEKYLQAIMDHSPAVICLRDTKSRFIFINSEFEKRFQLASKQIIGKGLLDIFPSTFAHEMISSDKVVLDNGRSLEIEEAIPQKGEIHTYTSVKFPLFDSNNEIYAICSISTDVTLRRQQEEQLHFSQKMDALGKLTGGIAHDYNNMLGVVLGYSELLNDLLNEQPELKTYTKEIIRAGERGAKLTKKLLAFSRQKSRKTSAFDLNSLLCEQRHMLGKTLTARINLEFTLQENLWPVSSCRSDLVDAIVNMCINAMHAIKHNGTLTIETKNTRIVNKVAATLKITPGDYVVLGITDTGSGMDNKTQKKIFDPFFSTKGDQGNGLGLSQVYGLVERSSGAITVQSTKNKGSCFTLYFPRGVLKAPLTDTVSKHNDLSLKGTECILIVDDEPSLVKLAQDILSRNGYQIVTASCTDQALSLLKTTHIDLILSDVIMPKMDGYEFAALVQKHYPKIKIQMVSGYTDKHHNIITDDALHQNMIHKPYSAQTLLTHIRQLLNA